MEDFIRGIIEYFCDPENVRKYEEWKKQKEDA